MHRSVLIYQDYVHNNGLLYRALRDHFGHVDYCDSGDIKSGILNDDVGLFVMPGGADLYYCEKLNGDGNTAIRRYVERGGSYLGICAGAYYACSAIEWAKGTSQEICGARELNFYDGIAIGPVYDFIEDRDIAKSWLQATPIVYDDGISSFEVTALYKGGPLFSGGSSRVLARYANGDAAIVESSVGEGIAILSSPHIECIAPQAELSLYRHRNENHDYENAILNRTKPKQSQQAALWQIILDRLTRSAAGVTHAA